MKELLVLALTLLNACSTGPVLKLVPVDDQVGSGREWFHAEYIPELADCPAPVFTVSPPIYIEAWEQDPFYGWIAGESGTYTVLASGTAFGCEGKASLVITIQH